MRTGYALRPVSLYNTVHTDSFTATIIIITLLVHPIKKGLPIPIKGLSKGLNASIVKLVLHIWQGYLTFSYHFLLYRGKCFTGKS